VSFGAGFSNPRAFIWQNGKMVDLNTLVPSDSSLYLLVANDINDEGVITGQACALINGACTSDSETPAFVAVPQGGGWNVSASPSAGVGSVGSASSKIVVPEKIRQQFLQRHGLGLQAGTAAEQ
jgi:hypothetical protein